MAHPDIGHWHEDASCYEMGNALFFSTSPSKKNQAKLICSFCPVRKPCLKYGMAFPEMRGIWGGLDKDERLELKRRIQEKKRLRLFFGEDKD